ncbi:MAG: DUF3397 family protein [Bacillaceae bacterium]|nr:DUF3397 family protein [Bacillaceae bacterium]
MNWFADVYAILATIPFISFFVLYLVIKWISRDSRKAAGWAVNVTTLLLLSSVAAMYRLIFQQSAASIMWWYVLFLLLFFGLFAFMQIKLKGELRPARLVRAVWRVFFLGLSITYVIFFLMGIVRYFQMT